MIVCGGENLIDVIEQPGGGVPRSFTAHVGGSPYNCSRAIARLGGVVGYLGALSTDSFGVQLLAALEADGVTHLGPRSAAPTTLAMVTLEAGLPDYRFYREGTAERQITLDTLRAELAKGATALHLGSIALVEGADADAWRDAFVGAAAVGLFTSLDPNVRNLIAEPNRAGYTARLEAMAAQARLIKLSDEDAGWWFPHLTAEAALLALHALAPQAVVILTQGPAEVLCRWRGGQFSAPPPKPEVLVDTVGAGDTLMAATLVGMARRGALSPAGLDALGEAELRAILSDATRAAAITCSRTGCNPPTARELWGEG